MFGYCIVIMTEYFSPRDYTSKNDIYIEYYKYIKSKFNNIKKELTPYQLKDTDSKLTVAKKNVLFMQLLSAKAEAAKAEAEAAKAEAEAAEAAKAEAEAAEAAKAEDEAKKGGRKSRKSHRRRKNHKKRSTRRRR